MLTFNFERIFKARGIDKPFSFLVRNGFTDNYATRLKNGKMQNVSLKHLEKLCAIMNCTPNELLHWAPDERINVSKDHPLHSLSKPDKIVDLKRTLSTLPIDKIYQLEELIKQVENEESKSEGSGSSTQ